MVLQTYKVEKAASTNIDEILNLSAQELTKKTEKLLHDQFAIISNGSRNHDTQFVLSFDFYSENSPEWFDAMILAGTPLGVEYFQKADKHYSFFCLFRKWFTKVIL